MRLFRWEVVMSFRKSWALPLSTSVPVTSLAHFSRAAGNGSPTLLSLGRWSTRAVGRCISSSGRFEEPRSGGRGWWDGGPWLWPSGLVSWLEQRD